jgi:hypothetical protein
MDSRPLPWSCDDQMPSGGLAASLVVVSCPESGNPNGRPHMKRLLTTMRNKVAETGADGRTIEANSWKCWSTRLGAASIACRRRVIFDRLEGRSTQRLDVNDVTADLRSRSDAELESHLRHHRWPAEGELSPTLAETRSDRERGKSEAESLTAPCVLSGPDRSQGIIVKNGLRQLLERGSTRLVPQHGGSRAAAVNEHRPHVAAVARMSPHASPAPTVTRWLRRISLRCGISLSEICAGT